MTLVLPNATSQSISFEVVDDSGLPVVLAHDTVGLEIRVKTTINGNPTLSDPLTLVARDVAGTWKSSALRNIDGTAEHILDVPNSFLAISAGKVSLAIVCPDARLAPAETLEIDTTGAKLTGITSVADEFAEIQAILASFNGQITVSNPLSSNGTRMLIVTGDSYTAENGRSFRCNITNQTGLIGSIPRIRLQGETTDFAVAPAVVSGTQEIVFDDVLATRTLELESLVSRASVTIDYQIRFDESDDKATPIEGKATIVKGL